MIVKLIVSKLAKSGESWETIFLVGKSGERTPKSGKLALLLYICGVFPNKIAPKVEVHVRGHFVQDFNKDPPPPPPVIGIFYIFSSKTIRAIIFPESELHSPKENL